MLYLNRYKGAPVIYIRNLTLTSVVFEFKCVIPNNISIIFNFNKCCIWIQIVCFCYAVVGDLTLTSVVFELLHPIHLINHQKNLTLTSVVFEFQNFTLLSLDHMYLTLTSVVFEFGDYRVKSSYSIFNFNKCCIWIKVLSIYLKKPFLFNFNKCCIWIRLDFPYRLISVI